MVCVFAMLILLMADELGLKALPADSPAQSTTWKQESDQWIVDTSFGFPVGIAYSSRLTTHQFADHMIFLFIEDRFCSKENLGEVFKGIAARYQETPSVRIDVYSDKEMLRRAIQRYKSYPDEAIFPDTPEGVELEKTVRGDLYIPKTGWARARYFKWTPDGERFVYKPGPQKTEMIEVIIKPAPVPEYSGEVQSDLFLACKLGDLLKAKSLIDGGASVGYEDNDGQTALVYAVAYNRSEIVKLLIAHGARIDAKNKYGQTALCEALSHGFHEITFLLIEHKADVNARYGPGISPLHLASYKGDAAAVEALLSKGANPNAADGDGNTPLFDAVRRRDARIVRALVKSGAWVRVKNNRGQALEALARETGGQEIIKLIRTN